MLKQKGPDLTGSNPISHHVKQKHPLLCGAFVLVELMGFEPTAFTMRM